MELAAGIDRQEFGRRDTHVRAYAVVGRRAPVACIILNVSERGAKIDHAGTLDGAKSLVLIVESLGLELKCEIRHAGGSGVGLRFVNHHAAAPLVRQTFPMVAVPLGTTVSSVMSSCQVAPVSGCELRSQLFGEKQTLADLSAPTPENITFNRKPRIRARRACHPATKP